MTRRIQLAAVATALTMTSGIGPAVAQQSRTPGEAFGIVRPARRAADAPPALPPPLPAAADRIAPLTLELVIRRQPPGGRSSTARQVVARTRQRVHVTTDDGWEWLFERNSVDGRRVRAARVIHAERSIVLYEESDLRNWLGIDGWADVLLGGVDAGALSGLAPTSRTRTAGGLTFVRLAPPDQTTTGVSELWWCEDQALPGGFTTRTGETTTIVRVERIRAGADAARLRDPGLRFPAYRVVDLAEWLEGR